MKEIAGSIKFRRRWGALVAALALTVASLSCGGSPPEMTVLMTEMAFEPDKVTVQRSTKTIIRLENRGLVEHNFSVPQLNATSAIIPPGKTGTLEITAPRGPLKIVCTVPGHEEMVAELVVAPRR
jgi:uncharacterized cupredoxin-like copper-binding protein